MWFWVWFLTISVLWLPEISVFFSADIEAFRSLFPRLSWEFQFLTSSFFFPAFPSDIRSNNPISLYSLVWQKYLNVLYTWSLRSLLRISVWLGVSDSDIFHISIARTYHGLSVLFLLLEIESLVSLNIIRFREPIQRTLELFQKIIHP